jgi:transcriptional regulator with GAF, ATPase, and Fis domain
MNEDPMVAARDIATGRGWRLVETFVELADTLVEDFDVVEFFSSLTERVVELGYASEAGILLVDEAGELQFVAASHERTHLLELFQVQNREGPCQDCFATGEPVGADDLEAAGDRWPQFAPRATSAGFRSVQAVPLRLRGTILGAFNLFITEPGGIDREAQAVVQAMADVATIGLLQQRELDRAHAVEGQLQQALQSRIGIEQAKGVISEQMHISTDAAFEMLRGYSRNHNRRLHDVARDLVEGKLAAPDLT